MKKKKISLEDALSNIENVITNIPNTARSHGDMTNITVEKANENSKQHVVKNNVKKLIVEINEEVYYQIHQLRLDLKKASIKELVSEALNDLFKKYNKPPIV